MTERTQTLGSKLWVLLALIGFASMTPVRAETVLITGASTGIGLEFAKQYAARGWTVYATHHYAQTPESLVALQKQYPQTVKAELLDVTKADHIAALKTKLAGAPIDILLNNAGLIRTAQLRDRDGNRNQVLGTLDYQLGAQFMDVNVFGPLRVIEGFLDNVKASKQKKLITISSAAGMVSVLPASADHYWYRSSKAALNSAMRLVSLQVKSDGVIVNFFHPGGVAVESFAGQNIAGLAPPAEAIGKMIKTIDGLTMADTGRFLTNEGKDQPW
jgi:NAD(P)-dependent dehydrogenase (short-subunit alcohol dehydrogenase family)